MAARTSLRAYQSDLAERLRRAEAGATPSKLGVQVGAEAWLVTLAEVSEVLPVPAITPLPLMRPWFKGLASIRGNLRGVVDFAAFLGGGATAASAEARLLVLAERFRLDVALLVDRSLGLRNPAQWVPGEAVSQGWSRGQYADSEGRQWQELDLAGLAQHPDFLTVAL